MNNQPKQEGEQEPPSFIMRPAYTIKPAKYLSASKQDVASKCGRKWAFTRADMSPSRQRGIEGSRMLHGTFVHRTLELFYAESTGNGDRTKQHLLEAFNTTCGEFAEPGKIRDDFDQLGLTDEEIDKFFWGVLEDATHIFDVENPDQIRVMAVEKEFDDIVTGVPTRGFIDRISYDGDHQIRVEDYKTGQPKEPYRRYNGTIDPPGEWTQMRWYTHVARELFGESVKSAVLIHPGHGQKVSVPIDDASIEETVIQFQRTWEQTTGIVDRLKAAGTNARFAHIDANPTPLCGWCDFLPMCQEGKKYLVEEPFAENWAKKTRNKGKTIPQLEYAITGVRPHVEWYENSCDYDDDDRDVKATT